MIKNEKWEVKVMVEMVFKMIVENISCSNWRKPTFPPSTLEVRVAKYCSLVKGILDIDNSNVMARK